MNDLLRRMTEYISKMWANMSPPQRMALVMLVALLVASVFWLVTLTAKNGMVVFVPPEETMDIKAQVKQSLDEKGYPYEIREGGAIYVPRQLREKIAIEIAGEGIFTGAQLEKWVFEPSLTVTRTQLRLQERVTLQRKLALAISSLDAVRAATVQITPPTERHTVLEGPPDAKASVVLTLKPGKHLTQQAILGIASVVANSVKGLQPRNVSIMDTSGRLYRIPDPEVSEVFQAMDRLEAELKHEKILEEKIRYLLRDFGTVYVGVDVKLDLSKLTQESHVVKPGTDVKVEEYTKTSSTTARGAPQGIKIEGRVKLPLETEAPTTSLLTERKTVTKHLHSIEKTWIERPPGEVKYASIAVLIPKRGGQSNPSPVQIKDLLRGATGIPVENISVAEIEVPKPQEIPIEPPSILERVGEIWDRFGGQILLSLLVLVSMFMVYRIIRHAMPKKDMFEEVEKLREKVAAEITPLPEMAEAEAGELRSRQMRESIKELSRKSPRSIAILLRRWLSGR
jgi:flagellar M-ring protein FliF